MPIKKVIYIVELAHYTALINRPLGQRYSSSNLTFYTAGKFTETTSFFLTFPNERQEKSEKLSISSNQISNSHCILV